MSRTRALSAVLLGTLICCRALLTAGSGDRLDIDPEALRPGLVAVYRSLAGDGQVLHQVDPKPAFTLGHSSPHPRIPPGPFEAIWNGIIKVQDPGPDNWR
jgi:hypothetical protein